MRLSIQDRLASLLPVLLAGLVAGMVALLAQNAQLDLRQRRPSPDDMDLQLKGVVLQRMNEQGKPLSRLQAQEMRHVPRDDTMLITAPTLHHAPPDSPEMRVRAEHAKARERASEIWFEGAVHLERAASAEQALLKVDTSAVFVNTRTQQARSDAPVQATMGAHRLSAVGFELDNRQQTLALLSKVRITYAPAHR